MKYLALLASLALFACSSDPHPYQAPGAKSSSSSKILGVSGALPTVEEGAPCRPADRGACACPTGPGIRSCESGTFGACACGGPGGFAGGGGVAVLDPNGGAAGMGGSAGQGGPTGGEAGQSGAAGSGTAGQGAPDCTPSSPCASFEANADGTVTDNTTGLTWATEALMKMSSPAYAGRSFIADNKRSYDPSHYCSEFFSSNLSTITGTQWPTGWRLPTVLELQTLLDSRWPYPYTTDPHFFKLTGPYWSSDTDTFNVPWSDKATSPTCLMGATLPCPAHRCVDFTSQSDGSIGPVTTLPDDAGALFVCVHD